MQELINEFEKLSKRMDELIKQNEETQNRWYELKKEIIRIY